MATLAFGMVGTLNVAGDLGHRSSFRGCVDCLGVRVCVCVECLSVARKLMGRSSFGECSLSPLVAIRESPEFVLLLALDRNGWPRCLEWHGSL